jgi:ABC-2 type transport system ATP-binding protein
VRRLAAGRGRSDDVTTSALFTCRDLHKRYGDTVAVDGVGFEVAAGEAYGLLGPNGAGKTTTISMICGLLAPDRGEVVLDGRRLADDPRTLKAAIGYVPQEIALYPDLTASENLDFFGRLYGLGGLALRRRVAEVLAFVELADRARDRVDTFSGGMKRRLNIAAGLLHRPRLLILDEPTVGVDPQSRNAILERVAELRSDGLALIYTSHYMEEVERLCDRIGIVDHGRMIAEGTRDELVGGIDQGDRIDLELAPASRDRAGALADALRALDGVAQATADGARLTLLGRAGRSLLPLLLERAAALGAEVVGVQVTAPDLETVFLQRTGKALRDR